CTYVPTRPHLLVNYHVMRLADWFYGFGCSQPAATSLHSGSYAANIPRFDGPAFGAAFENPVSNKPVSMWPRLVDRSIPITLLHRQEEGGEQRRLDQPADASFCER